jgi:hypothetical protein
MTIRLVARVLVLALLLLFSTSVAARADVILSFTFSAANFGENPQQFTFDFALPFSDGPYDTLTTEFSTSVTDLDQSGALNVNPADVSGFILVPHIDGIDVLSAALGSGCGPTGSGGFTTVCDPLSTASVAVSTLASGFLGATVAFILTGGDSISGAGTLTLSNAAVVPEPASLLLLGLGAAALAARRRRRRSA